jgi:hypothetical protein
MKMITPLANMPMSARRPLRAATSRPTCSRIHRAADPAATLKPPGVAVSPRAPLPLHSGHWVLRDEPSSGSSLWRVPAPLQ